METTKTILKNLASKKAILLMTLAAMGICVYAGYDYGSKCRDASFMDLNSSYKVIATVNGQNVYEDEITAINNGRIPTPMEKAGLLESYFTEVLLAQNYKKDDLANIVELEINRNIKSKASLASIARSAEKSVKESDIKSFYDNNISDAQYNKYKISYYLTQDENDANQTIKDFAQNKNLDKLKAIKTDSGELITANLIPYGMAPIVLKLNVGEITQTPILTRDGWIIFKLTEKQQGKKPKLEDVSQDIKNILASNVVANKIAAMRANADIRLK